MSSSSPRSSDLAEIFPRMEWTKSESTYSSCNEARTANSMLATMFLLASLVVPEPAVAFSILMSHLIPLFIVVFGIRQMGKNCLSGCRANWQILRPTANCVLIDRTLQLRSLGVVTHQPTRILSRYTSGYLAQPTQFKAF